MPSKTPRIRFLALDKLTLDDANANKGTKRGRDALAKSLKKYGAGRSVLVDKDGRVIAGNKTVESARAAGMKQIAVVEVDGSTLVAVQRNDLDLKKDKRAKELAVADNRVAEIDLDWNIDILKGLDVELGEFWNESEMRNVFGVEPIDAPEPKLDQAAELQKKWKTARGQIWEIGRHRLLCGDSRDSEQVSALLGDMKPTLMNTDPPYGIGIVHTDGATVGGSKPFGRTKRGPDIQFGSVASSVRHEKHSGFGTALYGPKSRNQIIAANRYPVIEGDDEPFDPRPFLAMAPIIVMWGANYFADKLPISSCWICWDKREDITRNSFADCELAWCSEKRPARLFHHLWNGLHKGSQHGQRRTHPTEKPVALFAEIGNMLSPNGIWLDLFAGTGAQIVAAEKCDATCYAAEWEPLYAAVALERLSEMSLTPKLLEKK